jgi:hypothetical protein
MSETVQDLRWRIGTSVNSDLYRQLLDLADHWGLTMTELVCYLLVRGLELSDLKLERTLFPVDRRARIVASN